MSYTSIPDAWRNVGKAIKQELVELIHDNLEDLDTRVTNVEGAVSTTLVLNELIKKERDTIPLGTITWSPLTEAQFQAESSDGAWELCDGASVTGSDYAVLMSRTTVPDIRGRFIRMRAHGTAATINPDGDVATDTAQADDTKIHGHANTFALGSATVASSTHRHDMYHAHQWAHLDATNSYWYGQVTLDAGETTIGSGSDKFMERVGDLASGGLVYKYAAQSAGSNTNYHTTGVLDGPSGTGSSADTGTPTATTTVTLSGAVTNSTGAEGRPKNITQNAFIKINKNYITVRDGYYIWRAPQDLTINQVILSPITQGTSGTLTIDVKKGALGAINTSIFTTLPDMAFGDATAQTGVINAVNAVITAGQYISVNITTTQAKLQEFHLLIGATPG